jgi:hypothetical protein
MTKREKPWERGCSLVILQNCQIDTFTPNLLDISMYPALLYAPVSGLPQGGGVSGLSTGFDILLEISVNFPNIGRPNEDKVRQTPVNVPQPQDVRLKFSNS